MNVAAHRQSTEAAGTRATGVVVLALALSTMSCGNSGDSGNPGDPAGNYFPTSSVVFGQDSISTYLSLLQTLDPQAIDYDGAREFAGWADLWVHEGKVFMTDGEAPALTRYTVAAGGALEQDGRLSFANYGADTAAFWRNVFAGPAKAYLFVPGEREVVVWNPETLEISGTFAVPELRDRASQQLYLTADRSAVVRGDRLYVPVAWGNWEDVSLSHDSAILVIDTTSDEVLATLPVACPDLNVGTIDYRGDIYFSNWVYGVTPALFEGGPHTCAVRIRAGQDVMDDDWSLTFADVTGGREAAALRFIGDGKALLSVFHDEEVALTPESDRYATLDAPHWKFWTVDLETRSAQPAEGIGWHSGGYYSTRIDERNMLFVPSADYASTDAVEFFADGSVEPRWEATGWVTRLFKLR
ncbi:MAG TPA: hypothetical protein VMM60_11935 [Ilumatobacter sp.]|nr:hypothetical protein [Ilumatobacter sp.]